MAEPAFKQRFGPEPVTEEESEESYGEPAEWETKLGKAIFYLTCALSLWFFYWLNGIQCPC